MTFLDFLWRTLNYQWYLNVKEFYSKYSKDLTCQRKWDSNDNLHLKILFLFSWHWSFDEWNKYKCSGNHKQWADSTRGEIRHWQRQTDGYCQDCQAMSAWRNVLFHNFLVTVTATLRVSLDTTGPIVKLSLTYINPFCGPVK